MNYTEAELGRIFILRLEHGDKIPDIIEEFAENQGIKGALVFFLGGAEKGSRVVVGPKDGKEAKPVPMLTMLKDVSEALGTGTLFANQEGKLKLHLHSAFGRERDTVTGCTRQGVEVWQIGEAVILELTGSSACRKVDPETGFELLEV
ncbi:PPC domain-containing DNA-binding protein [Candidatus Contubernalis alkaliaceticus]|uniref:PPC domain-containing DNA-binding protein n=1 Tax=Candidatus Contubernalis alkaliaceticus TaxID=338645 RepID=UPI001F4C0FDE|nr:PPC domain-containing DNA-binding protein [Candidatus Contubernalis alkalaceticus]UNC91320.1 DNA-binding protein [Candidatus Contubernalis alkalaceticus]